MSVRETRAFKAAIGNPALGTIMGIHDFDPSPAIDKVDRPVFVVSCYSDRTRQFCIEYRDFVLVIQNSYLLSFVDNIAVGALVAASDAKFDLLSYAGSLAKKFVAEQLYRLAPSSLARVLYLETVGQFEPHWRGPLLRRNEDETLKAASRAISQLTADFMLHHELGHVAAKDRRFYPFVRDVVEEYLADAAPAIEAALVRALMDEAEADLFALNCCIASYAADFGYEKLLEYLTFVARAVTAINVLYLFTDDIHHLNVDSTAPRPDMDRHMGLWAHREKIMCGYLESFSFGPDTVIAKASDSRLALPALTPLFHRITDGAQLTEPTSVDARRFAHVLDLGFQTGDGFEAVIGAVREPWVLSRD
ncbi:hypothetical protein HY29_17460 [Hyphomonas beringensis]|uniref:Uncharacterized protein n=1 Tax=Hyphomonas beringensis TaxID=1280946 RepID=A0A062U4K4_9PROT|nr:hypothetical protein [Hyphomonas beringensis]KCZ53202.1 hypothetical protein HY29_17460 [Hyphomonas beringensis]